MAERMCPWDRKVPRAFSCARGYHPGMNEKRKRIIRLWIIGLLLLHVAYILGVGPVLLWSKSSAAGKRGMEVYRPLGMALFYSSSARAVLIPYIRWWGNGAAVGYNGSGKIELMDGFPVLAP